MSALHEVARYLLERVPHNTQDEHDRVVALIDQHEAAEAAPQETASTEGSTEETS